MNNIVYFVQIRIQMVMLMYYVKDYATIKIIFSDIDNLCFCHTATRGQKLTAKFHIFSVLENIP